MRFLCIILGLILAGPAGLSAQTQTEVQDAGRRALATSSLAAKEYAEGVVDGRIVLTEEVEEAALFLTAAREALAVLPAGPQTQAAALVDRMLAAVENVADPLVVTRLADSLADYLDTTLGGLRERLPDVRPSSDRGASIYAMACASCHGENGAGNGVAAAGLDPAPSNLTDARALADQSPLDFYRKVLIGVAGTAMPPFEHQLSDEELWAVAWYASGLRYSAVEVERGQTIVTDTCDGCADQSGIPALARLPAAVADPAVIAAATDEQLALAVTTWLEGSPLGPSDQAAIVGYLRTLPFAVSESPGADPAFARVRTELARALRDARTNPEAAATRAFDSYVAFESVETALALRDHSLVTDLEFSFNELRNRAGAGASPEQLTTAYVRIDSLLDRAETTLTSQESATGLFAQSFILLVREGMEALLIVGALATLMVRAGAPERRREIGWGVGVALGASVVTAVLIETVFRIGVAQQEVLEGVTMLVAAVVLLFVSYWLISRIEVNRWKSFVSAQGNRALRSGSRFALGAAAFLAVYREGFETVLFYKALFITADGAGFSAIALGAVAGTLVLGVVWVAIARFGLRIPMRPFFAVTSAVLMYMAFTFVGKGIAELQESALINMTILDWAPRVPWMGIYPTAQTLIWQLGIVTLILAGLVWTFVLEPRFVRQTT